MKANTPKALLVLCLLTSQLLTFSTAFARASGGGAIAGGGGDATEERVSEIRSDILKWINLGGARDLRFNEEINYETYVAKMKGILKAQEVIVNFTDKVILVNGIEKTCRSFLDEEERGRIRCNISRFKATAEADQYRLIHHEYAGLSGVEKNLGSASDYEFSSQITNYLTIQTVLRLAVKKGSESPVMKVPLFKVFKAKEISHDTYEIEVGLENAEDVMQISYKKDNKRVYFKNTEERIKFLGFMFFITDVIVQYKDGSIEQLGDIQQRINCLEIKGSSTDFFKAKALGDKIIHMKKDALPAYDYRILDFEVTLDFSHIDLSKYRGVEIPGLKTFYSEDSLELAKFINSKVINYQLTQGAVFKKIKWGCSEKTERCLYEKLAYEDNEYSFSKEPSGNNFKIVLIKKGDITVKEVFQNKIMTEFN